MSAQISVRIKAWFIVPLVALQATTIAVAIVHGYRAPDLPSAACWLPPLGVAAAFLAFIGWLFRSRRARTSRQLPALQVTAGVAAVATAACFSIHGPAAALSGTLTLLTAAGILAYIHWYSRLARPASESLWVGSRLPHLEFTDLRGRKISSVVFDGQPSIILFYRGNWCPLCSAQVAELAAGYREIAATGTRVFLVSCQSRDETLSLAARFDAPMEFLEDAGGAMARRLGIFHSRGVPVGVRGFGKDTVLPTVIITDRTGRIVYVDQTDNYRVRPEPAEFLRVLGSLPVNDGASPAA